MLKFIRSVRLAASGIGFAVRTQRHMQIHCIAAVIVIALGAAARLSAMEWAIVAIVIAMVICAELINTAIEQVVNLASPEHHPIAKLAKDVAAGAVLAAAIIAVITGLLIIGPPLCRLWFGL